MSDDNLYKDADIVWVKLGNSWWPGEVIGSPRQPDDLLKDRKVKPYCVVKFFEEDTYETVKNKKGIYPYHCNRKNEFKKKGYALHEQKMEFMQKFPQDVETAERLTRSQMEKSDIVIINDRPDSIVKAIMGSSVPHGTADYYSRRSSSSISNRFEAANQSNYNSASRRDSVTKILNITSNRANSLIELKTTSNRRTSTIITPDSSNEKTSRRSSIFSTPSNNQTSRLSVKLPTPNQISLNRSNSICGADNSADAYRCNMCDFTTTRQNVLILHRKSHSYSTPAVKSLTPASKHSTSTSVAAEPLLRGEHSTRTSTRTRNSNESTSFIRSTDADSAYEQQKKEFIAEDDVPTTSKACARLTSKPNTSPSTSPAHTTTSTPATIIQKRNSEDIRKTLLADWSDVELEDLEEQNASTALNTEADIDVRASTSTAALSALQSSTSSVSITNKSQRIRNIPKKDRRDVIISEFNHDVNNFSSNSTTAASSVASTPPIGLNLDMGCHNSNSSDSVVVIESNIVTTTAPSAQQTQIENESIAVDQTAATTNAPILSCFDFQEDEDENDNDVLTAMANLRKKYTPDKANKSITSPPLSAERKQKTTQSKALKQKLNERERQDKKLAAEINSLLEETVVGSVVTSGNGEDVTTTVKALPIKERGKRIFKSRNRSRVDEDEVAMMTESRNQSTESVEQLKIPVEDVQVEQELKPREVQLKGSRTATPEPTEIENVNLKNGENDANANNNNGNGAHVEKNITSKHDENTLNGFQAVVRDEVISPAVQAAPLECLTVNTPTDETSSLGISETGAEFGSPTSMLSDERLLTRHGLLTPTDEGLRLLVKSPRARKEEYKEERPEKIFENVGTENEESNEGDVMDLNDEDVMDVSDDEDSDSPPFEALSGTEEDLAEKDELEEVGKKRFPKKKPINEGPGVDKNKSEVEVEMAVAFNSSQYCVPETTTLQGKESKSKNHTKNSRTSDTAVDTTREAIDLNKSVVESVQQDDKRSRRTRGSTTAARKTPTALESVELEETVQESKRTRTTRASTKTPTIVDTVRASTPLETLKKAGTLQKVELEELDQEGKHLRKKRESPALAREPTRVEILKSEELQEKVELGKLKPTVEQLGRRSRGKRGSLATETQIVTAAEPVEKEEPEVFLNSVKHEGRQSRGKRASTAALTKAPIQDKIIKVTEPQEIVELGEITTTVEKQSRRSRGKRGSPAAAKTPIQEETLKTPELEKSVEIGDLVNAGVKEGRRSREVRHSPASARTATHDEIIKTLDLEENVEIGGLATSVEKEGSRGKRGSPARTCTPVHVLQMSQSLENEELTEKTTNVAQEVRRSRGKRGSPLAARMSTPVKELKKSEQGELTPTAEPEGRGLHGKRRTTAKTARTQTSVETLNTADTQVETEIGDLITTVKQEGRRSRGTRGSPATTARTQTPVETLNTADPQEKEEIGDLIATVKQEGRRLRGTRESPAATAKTPTPVEISKTAKPLEKVEIEIKTTVEQKRRRLRGKRGSPEPTTGATTTELLNTPDLITSIEQESRPSRRKQESSAPATSVEILMTEKTLENERLTEFTTAKPQENVEVGKSKSLDEQKSRRSLRKRESQASAKPPTPVEILTLALPVENVEIGDLITTVEQKDKPLRGKCGSPATTTQSLTPAELIENTKNLASVLIQDTVSNIQQENRSSPETPMELVAAETIKEKKKHSSAAKRTRSVTHSLPEEEADEVKPVKSSRRSAPAQMEESNNLQPLQIETEKHQQVSSGTCASPQPKSQTLPITLEEEQGNKRNNRRSSGAKSETRTPPPIVIPTIAEEQHTERVQEQAEHLSHEVSKSPPHTEPSSHRRKRRSHLKITPRRRLSAIETKKNDKIQTETEPKMQKIIITLVAESSEQNNSAQEYRIKTEAEKSKLQKTVERKTIADKSIETAVANIAEDSKSKTLEQEEAVVDEAKAKTIKPLKLSKQKHSSSTTDRSATQSTSSTAAAAENQRSNTEEKIVERKSESEQLLEKVDGNIEVQKSKEYKSDKPKTNIEVKSKEESNTSWKNSPATATSSVPSPTTEKSKSDFSFTSPTSAPSNSTASNESPNIGATTLDTMTTKTDDDLVEIIEISDAEAVGVAQIHDESRKSSTSFTKSILEEDLKSVVTATTKTTESRIINQKLLLRKQTTGWEKVADTQTHKELKKEHKSTPSRHEERSKQSPNIMSNNNSNQSRQEKLQEHKAKTAAKRLSDDATHEDYDIKRQKSFEDDMDIPAFVIERPSNTTATSIKTKTDNKRTQILEQTSKRDLIDSGIKGKGKLITTAKSTVTSSSTAIALTSPIEAAAETFKIIDLPIEIELDGVALGASCVSSARKESKVAMLSPLPSTAHLPELPRIIQHTIIKPADNPYALQKRSSPLTTHLATKRPSPSKSSGHSLEKIAKLETVKKLPTKRLPTATVTSNSINSNNSTNANTTNKQIGMDVRGNKYVIIKTELPLQQQQQLKSNIESSVQRSSPPTTSKPKSPAAAAAAVAASTGGRKQAGNTITIPGSIPKRQQKFSDQLAAVEEAMQQQYQQQKQKQEKQRQLLARRGSVQTHHQQQQLLKRTSAGASTSQRRQSANADLTSHLALKKSFSTNTASSASSSPSSQSPGIAIQQRLTEHPLHNRTPKKQPQQHRNLQRKSSTNVVETLRDRTALTPPLTLNTHVLSRQLSQECQEQQQRQEQQQVQVELEQVELIAEAQSEPITITTPVNSNATITGTIVDEDLTAGKDNLSAQIATDEQSTESPKQNILAVPHQSNIPGYTEIFLLCTLIDNEYKPIDNIPLYLDDATMQLVRVPEEAIIGLPNLVLSQTSPEETVNQMQVPTNASKALEGDAATQLVCLEPSIEEGGAPVVSLDDQLQVEQQLLEEEPITEVAATSDGTVGGAVVTEQIENFAAGEADNEIMPGNAVILSIQGQQIILDAATLSHLLANPDANTQLVTDDGTEFLLTRELLAALEAQQQEAVEQQQQQLLVNANASDGGPATDILAVALAGSDLYGNEVLEIETSQLVDGNIIFSPTGLPQQHLTASPITAHTSETNVNQTPIMSTLEKPSTVSIPTTTAGMDETDLTTCRRNLDDSLAEIGVTAQSSTVPPSLELPITITNPAIAPRVTMAAVPATDIVQLQLESRIFSEPDS